MDDSMFFIESNGTKMRLTLGYNEKKKCITATPITIVDGVEIKGKPINNLDLILELLHALSRQSKKSLSELFDDNSITVSDSRLLNDGVIIDKSGEYSKIFFNKESGEFEEKRISRLERKELGMLGRIDDIEEKVEDHLEKDEKLIELMDIVDVVNEIKKLNPGVEIELGDKASDSRYYTRFFSSIPANDLKLPNGFYYSDKNGITNKHNTASGRFVFFDVEPLVKKEETRDTVLETPEEIKPEVADVASEAVVDSDGSIDVSETTDEHEKAEVKTSKKSKIKGLRICAGALALITAGVILVHNFGSMFKSRNNTNDDSRNDDNNQPRYEDSTQEPVYEKEIYATPSISQDDEIDDTVYVNTDVYEFGKYSDYGSAVADEDMETQLNQINIECFALEPRTLHNLVIESDKPTLRIINDARNNALTNRNYLIGTLDSYVKYVLEGGTMFDGNVIKAFDYLSPYAKYIVLVSGESLLSLCHNYNYSTIYNENGYDFDSVVEGFDFLIDKTYRELTGKSMIR